MPNPDWTDPFAEISNLIAEGEFDHARKAIQGVNRTRLEDWKLGRLDALELTCLARDEEKELAAQNFIESVLTQSKTKEYLLALGIELSEQDELEIAEKVLLVLCRKEPNHHLPPYNLGLVFERGGKFPAALEQFEIALKHTPDFAPALLRKAATLKSMNSLVEARDWYGRYLKLQPDDAHEWVNKAIVESDLGDYAAATASYESARKAEPDSVSLYFNWAITAERQHDTDRIATCAAQLARIDSEEWRTHFVAAWHAKSNGQLYQAWEHVCDAFDCAADEERSYAAGMALHFASENSLANATRSLISKIFDEQCFGEMVYLELRRLESNPSSCARNYRVVLEGPMSEMESRNLEQLDIQEAYIVEPRGEAKLDYHYYRHMAVYAESEEAARRFAVDFETRCGEKVIGIDSIEDHGPEESEIYLGVRWRSGKIIFPKEEMGER